MKLEIWLLILWMVKMLGFFGLVSETPCIATYRETYDMTFNNCGVVFSSGRINEKVDAVNNSEIIAIHEDGSLMSYKIYDDDLLDGLNKSSAVFYVISGYPDVVFMREHGWFGALDKVILAAECVVAERIAGEICGIYKKTKSQAKSKRGKSAAKRRR